MPGPPLGRLRSSRREARPLRWRRLTRLAAVAWPLAALVVSAATVDPTMAELRVLKLDAATGQPLQGAKFEIHQDSQQGAVVATVTTGSAGTATATVAADHVYCLHETQAPPGYLPAGDFCTSKLVASTVTTVQVADAREAAGTLQVVKTNPSGQTVTVAGARFDVHQATLSGKVVATVTTGPSGTATAPGLQPATYCVEETAAPPGYQLAPQYTPSQCVPVTGGTPAVVSVADPPAATPAVAAALNPATYCVEEIAAAEGYQLAPAYSPGACVSVTADTTQGRSPTRVTVTDPPAPSPSPSSTSDAGTTTSSPAPGSGARVSSRPASTFGFSPGTLSRLLIGLGGLLLLVGVVLTVVAIRRRRSKPPAPPPPTDYWYDSTIG